MKMFFATLHRHKLSYWLPPRHGATLHHVIVAASAINFFSIKTQNMLEVYKILQYLFQAAILYSQFFITKALKDIFDQDQQHKIYDKLLPLMKSASSAPSIRILSYDQLLLVSEGYNFQEHLFTILKDDENSEVKLYIAESLNSLTTDHEFKSNK